MCVALSRQLRRKFGANCPRILGRALDSLLLNLEKSPVPPAGLAQSIDYELYKDALIMFPLGEEWTTQSHTAGFDYSNELIPAELPYDDASTANKIGRMAILGIGSPYVTIPGFVTCDAMGPESSLSCSHFVGPSSEYCSQYGPGLTAWDFAGGNHDDLMFEPMPSLPPPDTLYLQNPPQPHGQGNQGIGLGNEDKEKNRCPYPDCRRVFKDLKAHMLTHQTERPEKCPIATCEYHVKGFARKYDKNRHTLTHYKGTMVCGFCSGSGSQAEKSFNRADVFKRHLTAVHGVEQPAPNKKNRATPAAKGNTSTPNGRCSTCLQNFSNPQTFYEHLDDCVLQIVQQNTVEAVQVVKTETLLEADIVRRERESSNISTSSTLVEDSYDGTLADSSTREKKDAASQGTGSRVKLKHDGVQKQTRRFGTSQKRAIPQSILDKYESLAVNLVEVV